MLSTEGRPHLGEEALLTLAPELLARMEVHWVTILEKQLSMEASCFRNLQEAWVLEHQVVEEGRTAQAAPMRNRRSLWAPSRQAAERMLTAAVGRKEAGVTMKELRRSGPSTV